MTEETPQKYKKPIDWEIFRRLCNQQLTEEEIAATFDVSIDTLSRRCMVEKGKTFKELRKVLSTAGQGSLRRQMWKTAFRKDSKDACKMQIYLSKNYLGMAEKIEDDRYKDLRPLIIETSKESIKLNLEKEEEE